jgi:histidine ammonia-lyase/tyrosine ammonia-lyase
MSCDSLSVQAAPQLYRLPGRLTPAMLEAAEGPIDVLVDGAARQRILSCQEFALRCGDGTQRIYGMHTGFGPLVGFSGRADSADQCENTLAHLGAGH